MGSLLRHSVTLASCRTLSFCCFSPGFLPLAFVQAWVGRLRSCLGSFLLFFWGGGALLPLSSLFSLGGSNCFVVQAPCVFLYSLLGFFPLASSVCWYLGVVGRSFLVIRPPLLGCGRCYPGFLSGACRLALVGLRCLWVPRSCRVHGLRDGTTCLRSGLCSSSVRVRNEDFPSFWWAPQILTP